jgi:hypothetical protein
MAARMRCAVMQRRDLRDLLEPQRLRVLGKTSSSLIMRSMTWIGFLGSSLVAMEGASLSRHVECRL